MAVSGPWHFKDCSNSEMSETIHPKTSSYPKTRTDAKGFVVSDLVVTAILGVGATRKIPQS
jgi:hypothetical protein